MNLLYKLTITALCFSLMGILNSCIYEDEVVCPCEVRFVYDYNMEFADAFPSQVNDVTLFVFDSEGRFIFSRRDSGDHLDADYRMPLELSPGHYRLIVWAGLDENNTGITLKNTLQSNVSTINDLELNLNINNYICDSHLSDVWYGKMEDFEVKDDAPSYATISLVKDVKRFKILLQDTEGKTLSKEDYSFTISTANKALDHNNLPSDNNNVAYLPYSLQEVTIENEADSRSNTDINALVAEMASLRLTDERPARFTVRNKRTQKDLFDIDLVKYLNMMKLDEYSDMTLQEFLDRESTYQIILIIGKNDSGQDVTLSIRINAWTLVFNQTEL